MVALGQWDEFRPHVRAALTEGGFTPDDIKEILLQQAIYCGVPAANHATKEAPGVIQELRLLKGEKTFPPAPCIPSRSVSPRRSRRWLPPPGPRPPPHNHPRA